MKRSLLERVTPPWRSPVPRVRSADRIAEFIQVSMCPALNEYAGTLSVRKLAAFTAIEDVNERLTQACAMRMSEDGSDTLGVELRSLSLLRKIHTSGTNKRYGHAGAATLMVENSYWKAVDTKMYEHIGNFVLGATKRVLPAVVELPQNTAVDLCTIDSYRIQRIERSVDDTPYMVQYIPLPRVAVTESDSI